MKKQRKAGVMLAFIMAMCLGSEMVTASAEDRNICTVIGENEGAVYLSNGCAMTQKAFQEYSGRDVVLTYGDVIAVRDANIEPIAPGYYNLDSQSEVMYLGSVEEYYANQIKELTVKDISQTCAKITFADADGTVYEWFTEIESMDHFGYQPGIDPRVLHVGDEIECAVETAEYYAGDTLCTREEVIIPFLKRDQNYITHKLTEASLLGDITGDGKVGVMDVVALNKSLLGVRSLADELAFFSADMNCDGAVDIFDLALLKRKVLYK